MLNETQIIPIKESWSLYIDSKYVFSYLILLKTENWGVFIFSIFKRIFPGSSFLEASLYSTSFPSPSFV